MKAEKRPFGYRELPNLINTVVIAPNVTLKFLKVCTTNIIIEYVHDITQLLKNSDTKFKQLISHILFKTETYRVKRSTNQLPRL